MILKKLNALVGKAYDAEKYHCYHFIEEVLPVPVLTEVHVDTAKGDFEKYKDRFDRIDEPVDFCIVQLGEKHIGIWYQDGIFHNDIQGVRYETQRVMKMKYKNFTFFNVRGAA